MGEHKFYVCSLLGMNQEFKFKTAQNSKNLRHFSRSSFEFQSRNYVTCFSHFCNHPHGQKNYTQKCINTVLITV